MEARTAITLDAAGGEVWALDADRQTQGASTVKTVTAWLARQYLDMDEQIEVLASDDIYVRVVLQGGDVARVEDMIYSLLLPSDNFAGNAIARTIGHRLLVSEGTPSPTPAQSIARYGTLATAALADRGWAGHLIVDGSGVDETSHFTMRQIADHFRRLHTDDPWIIDCAGTTTWPFQITGARTVNATARHSARTYYTPGWIAGKTGTMLDGTAYMVWSWRHPNGQVLTSALGESTRAARPTDAAEIVQIATDLIPTTPLRYTDGTPAVLRTTSGNPVTPA